MSKLKFLLVLFAFTGIGSCGGGGDGGGGSPDASFPSTPANLATGNGTTYANAVALAARMAATMRLSSSLTFDPSTPGRFTETGCLSLVGPSGGLVVNVTPTTATGPVSGAVTYNSFHRCYEVRVAGNASLTGTFASNPQVDIVNLSFNGLNFTANGQTYQMSGTAVLDWEPFTGGPGVYALTLNVTVSGASSFRLENFRVDAQTTAGIQELSLTGRLFMADGFVEITPRSPADPPEVFEPSTGLSHGGVVLLGATTRATVFYNGETNPPNVTIGPR